MRKKAKGSRPAHLVKKAKEISADIDTRLSEALDVLRGGRSIPATEGDLAQLAGCSRGTVRNRAKVWEALQVIKGERKKPQDTSQREDETKDLNGQIETLKAQLKAARDETQVQFNKRQVVQRKFDKLQKLYALQAQHLADAKAKLVALGGGAGSVVPFRPAAGDS